jgi:amino acid adenylation domain-containing protein
VAAVLGVLRAAAAYVPIDPSWPLARRRQVVDRCGIAVVLTDRGGLSWPEGVARVVVDAETRAVAGLEEAAAESATDGTTEDLAYVIHTSGSSGEPKGVMISHAGAWNTIAAVNLRWQIGAADAVLAVSALSFDLSVYDVFGLLAAGGRVVVPSERGWRDPAHWAELVARERVTVWNSVPALMELLLDYAEQQNGAALLRSLRLVLLSGDWVPVELAARVRRLAGAQVEVVSLGGATEGSIWSIAYPIGNLPAGSRSVPYGRALPNQRVYVLDDALRERGAWATGELYLGGRGVALGYWGDDAQTAARFVHHPNGAWLYCTGDLGRHRDDGEIEFLGREDDQVKVRGYRVELGEIEAALRRCEGVREAAVVALGEPGRQERRLAAYLVATASVTPTPDSLRAALSQSLPPYMIPASFSLLPKIPLTSNGKIDRKRLTAMASDSTRVLISRDIGTQIAERVGATVARVLKRETMALDADLITLGITSVDAVRIANALKSEFGVRPELQDIYRSPTIRGLVAAITAERRDSELSATQRFDLASTGDGVTTSSDDHRRSAIRLPITEDGDGTRDMRRTHRAYSLRPVSFVQIGGLLDCMRQRSRDGMPARRYPSAGGRYAVRLLLHLKPGRVERLHRGVYAYDPVLHSLTIVSDEEPDARIHEPFLNRAIFHEAAFSIFLTARVAELADAYGALARDFCLLEAGHIAELLAAESATAGLGMCAIGYLDFAAVRTLIGLDDGFELLHSLVGGVPEKNTAFGLVPTGTRFEDRVVRLIDRIRDLPSSEIERLLAKTDERSKDSG